MAREEERVTIRFFFFRYSFHFFFILSHKLINLRERGRKRERKGNERGPSGKGVLALTKLERPKSVLFRHPNPKDEHQTITKFDRILTPFLCKKG